MSMKTMKTRLNYMGGSNQQIRMNTDKERSLRKALLYSYQAATAILSDGREFRCLINPNKLSLDLEIEQQGLTNLTSDFLKNLAIKYFKL